MFCCQEVAISVDGSPKMECPELHPRCSPFASQWASGGLGSVPGGQALARRGGRAALDPLQEGQGIKEAWSQVSTITATLIPIRSGLLDRLHTSTMNKIAVLALLVALVAMETSAVYYGYTMPFYGMGYGKMPLYGISMYPMYGYGKMYGGYGKMYGGYGKMGMYGGFGGLYGGYGIPGYGIGYGFGAKLFG